MYKIYLCTNSMCRGHGSTVVGFMVIPNSPHHTQHHTHHTQPTTLTIPNSPTTSTMPPKFQPATLTATPNMVGWMWWTQIGCGGCCACGRLWEWHGSPNLECGTEVSHVFGAWSVISKHILCHCTMYRGPHCDTTYVTVQHCTVRYITCIFVDALHHPTTGACAADGTD